MKYVTEGCAIVKPDAIEDGLSDHIIENIRNRPQVTHLEPLPVTLTYDDAYGIYLPEMFDDDSQRRRRLMQLGIRAMVGLNIFLTIEVATDTADDRLDALRTLNRIKGKSTDEPQLNTIRGCYKTVLPDCIDTDERDRYIVRNRLHIPDTLVSYDACAALYERLRHG